MTVRTIAVLYKVPGHGPVKLDIDRSDVRRMQELVGGFIEAIAWGDYLVICNEEGRLTQLPYNFALARPAAGVRPGGRPLAFIPILGSAFVTKADPAEPVEFGSLSPEDCERITRAFLTDPTGRLDAEPGR